MRLVVQFEWCSKFYWALLVAGRLGCALTLRRAVVGLLWLMVDLLFVATFCSYCWLSLPSWMWRSPSVAAPCMGSALLAQSWAGGHLQQAEHLLDLLHLRAVCVTWGRDYCHIRCWIWWGARWGPTSLHPAPPLPTISCLNWTASAFRRFYHCNCWCSV